MQKTLKRVLAVGLSAVMAVSAFSISAAAYSADFQSETHTVFKHTEQTLAPGVEYYNNYAYSSDGKQMVYYVATAEIDREDVLVQGSYMDSQVERKGMSKLTEQVASANAKFSDPSDEDFISENYTVVAGTNGDFYNMQTGQPSGAFAINGKIMNNANNRPWFAIFEDGTALCGANDAEYNAAIAEHGAVQNSVGGSQMLVVNGADVTANASGSYNTDRHSRTMIGVTADNKVVCAVLDGRQEPFSCGGSMHELAQIMLEADCVVAINLDGGGSTTFGARPEGEDSFKVLNRPSDGSERSISSGVVIASLAAPSNVFDHVSMTAADEYVTPGTSTEITVTGVSASGSSADIPADIAYDVTGGTFADGVFTAGNAGVATVTAMYNGAAVGSVDINVVVPDAIDFTSENYTIPYSKNAELGIIAKYGLNEVKTKASDYTFTIANPAAGTIDGFTFTAADESEIAETTISAVLNGTELTASAGIVFGKGSDVIFDFEDGTTEGFNLSYSGYNYYLPNSKVFVADKENGQVHSGDYALGLNIDYSNSQEAGYQMIALYQGKVSGNVNYYPDAIKLGAWLYIPDEYVGLWVRWTVNPISAIGENAETGEPTYTIGGGITSNNMDNGAGGTGVVYSFDEPGWHYLWTDLTNYKGVVWRDFYYCMQFYISDRDGASYGYYAKNNYNINGNFTVYMDDVTVDYSTVVEDRDAPVFSQILLGDRGPHSNEAMVLENGYVSDGYNQLSFSARVADFAASNASGINPASVKAYVDGNDVGCTYNNGILSAGEEVTLPAGKHTVKFVAYDNTGNRASITRSFTVSNISSEFIKVVPHDPTLTGVLHGSLYWVDVVSTDAAATDSVVTTLNLDSMSKWELDHMTVADGFSVSYRVVDEGDKVVEITITNEGTDLTGEQVLASLPIRTWEMDNMTKRNATSSGKNWNYAEFKASNEFWQVAVAVRVQQGIASRRGSRRYFTGDDIFCWSESWANNANMVATQEGQAYKASWNGGHDHRPEYADFYAAGTTNYVAPIVSKEAKAPTCTEAGWTEELFCTECNSVVKWSEPIPATGHSFKLNLERGAVVCSVCGEVDTTVNGLIQQDGKNYYAKLGVLADGWNEVDGDWYYFDPETKEGVAAGTYRLTDGVKFDFEDGGKLVSGKWVKTVDGMKYYFGPKCYKNGWHEVDGKTYAFDYYGVLYTGPIACIGYSNIPPQEYQLEEDGALISELTDTGVVKASNGTFYCENGVAQKKGVVTDGENFYYINSSYKAVTSCTYGVGAAKTNGLIPAGTYEFDENGVITNLPAPTEPTEPEPTEPTQPAEIKQGLTFDDDGEIRFYVDGEPTYAGVVTDGENFYYINSSRKAVKNCEYGIGAAKTNDLIPAGKYQIDADGKIIIPEPVEPSEPQPSEPTEVKQGLSFDDDGEIRFYVNGVPTYAGVVTDGENFYYINSSCKAVKNCEYGIGAAKTNDLIPAGKYEIDADGKILIPEPQTDPDPQAKEGLVFEDNGDIRFYVNGEPSYAGVVTDGQGNYYYINSSYKAVKNCTYGIGAAKTNGLIPAGKYQINADGKIILN